VTTPPNPKSEHDFLRLVQWAGAGSLGLTAGFVESIKSVNPTVRFELSLWTLLVCAAVTGASWYVAERAFFRALAEGRKPPVSATEAAAGELPGYARGRLQTKVRETYGAARTAEKEETKETFGSWRWLLGLATATAVLALIVFPSLTPKPRVSVQVAMLDLAGTSRGADTNEVALLRQAWQDAPFENFSQATKLEDWEKTWPQDAKGTVAKIICDRSAGEVRVIGRHKGQPFQRTFPVGKNLPGALKLFQAF
jgi:hypothetical protein